MYPRLLISTASCEGRILGETWQEPIQKTADIVFVVSEDASIGRTYDLPHRLQHLARHIEDVLKERESFVNNRYGLVGFNGAGERLEPHSCTVNG